MDYKAIIRGMLLCCYGKEAGIDSRPLSCPSVVRLSSVCHSYALVALAAIHRSAHGRLEGNFGVDATGGTYSREHAPGGVEAPIAASTFLLPCSAAVWTALGIIGIAFGSEELLFGGTKGEGVPTVNAL
jgi:hypothetical protein